jgi:hypothetical protein
MIIVDEKGEIVECTFFSSKKKSLWERVACKFKRFHLRRNKCNVNFNVKPGSELLTWNK